MARLLSTPNQNKMPIRLPINCDYPNCRTAIPAGTRYCARHEQPTVADKAEATQHERNRTRNEPWRKWYHTAHWRNLRTLVLSRDPVCMICQRFASTVADHIKPHKGMWSLFCDLANLQGLCKSCHDTKTATEDGGGGNQIKNAETIVMLGEPGKQFSSSSVGEAALDRALNEPD